MSSASTRRPSLLDAELDAALEVVLVVDLGEPLEQRRLVLGGDEVDPDGLAEPADDLLGELLDVAVVVEGVLHLFLGHRLGVHAHEAAPGLDVLLDQRQHPRVEDHVAVEPQHAAGLARAAAP